jgi:DNA-binding MarR family transcriptional regulator
MKLYHCPMNESPSVAVTAAWTRLLRAQQAAQSSIEAALKRAGMPPLVWYDVLLELDRGPEGGMRPFELEPRLLLPQYGLSRLLDRIETAGYLERRPCEADGRGQIITITQAGRELRARMWPIYGAAISAVIGERLNDDEAATLSELLAKLTVS